MIDTQVLKSLIKQSAKVSLEGHYKKKKAVLHEYNTKDSTLEIYNLPDDAIIIGVDASFSNSKLFNGFKGECKRSDYIIISEQKRVVLFIEIKKGDPSDSNMIKQLKGSLCVFEYIRYVAREFFDQKDLLRSYKNRFIAFTHVNYNKKLTGNKKKQQKGSGRTPQDMKKIPGTNVQFEEIL